MSGREGVGADAWKRRPGVDICASELIPPPCACTGARYVCVYMCARETKERERRRDEGESGWRREGGGGGMTGVSSRAGEITHFDGIKMSVFPTPICGEIARNRALRRRERKRERGTGGREDSCLLSFFAGHLYSGEKMGRAGGVTFLRLGKRGEKVSRSRSSTSLNVVQNVIPRCISERSWEREEGCLSYYFASIIVSYCVPVGIYGDTNGDCVTLLHFTIRCIHFITHLMEHAN